MKTKGLAADVERLNYIEERVKRGGRFYIYFEKGEVWISEYFEKFGGGGGTLVLTGLTTRETIDALRKPVV